jgi:hypothetical protein
MNSFMPSIDMPSSERSPKVSRLQYAKMAIRLLVTEVLRKDDRLSVSTFEDVGEVVFPLLTIAEIDADSSHFFATIEALAVRGGTVLSAGVEVGRGAIGDAAPRDSAGEQRASRIMLLTDMCEMGPGDLEEQIKRNADEGVYLTIVALGVEFGAALTETVTKNKGSLYYSVTNAPELRDAIVDNATSMFPVAFDVELTLQSSQYGAVQNVYGTPFDFEEKDRFVRWSPTEHKHFSPAARALASTVYLKSAHSRKCRIPLHLIAHIVSFAENSHRQSIMEVNTFFPSAVSDDGNISGGLILLETTSVAGSVAGAGKTTIGLQYKDIHGHVYEQTDHTVVVAPIGVPPMATGLLDVSILRKVMSALPFPADDARMLLSLKKGILLQKYCMLCRRFLGSTSSVDAKNPFGKEDKEDKDAKTQLSEVQDLCATSFPGCKDMEGVALTIGKFLKIM